MDTSVKIECMYSCKECGLKKIKVLVPSRTTEEVSDWLLNVARPEIVKDHETRSPNCRPKTLSELYIPVHGVDKIGGPAIQ